MDRNFLIRMLRRVDRWRHSHRRDAYRACLLGPDDRPTIDGDIMLADLKRFCKVEASSFVPGDPHATSLNEGRREVWNRIISHLYLSDETISRMVEQTYPDEGVMTDED